MLDRILEVLTGSQWIQDKLQRNEHVIRLLKQLGLDPDHPPTDFEGVYNYALVEYGVDKPRPCLEIFRAKEIQQAFRTAFDQNNAQLWLESGDQFLASSAIGDAVAAIGLDPQRELALFAAQFVTVAKRTRHAGDVLLSHQVADVQQSVRRMAGQLETLASQGAILPGRGAAIAGSDPALLPAATCRAAALAQQMRGWFETLGYRFEAYEVWHADYFEWVINIPVRRGRYDRVLVRGVAGEVGIQEVRSLCESVAAQKTDEGWVVTDRRISQAARGELAKLEASEDAGLAAFTWDELLDQDADFSSYVDWLTAEIERRGIEAKYVPLACTKEEVDPSTHQRLGVSRYGAADGWTEGYIDRWLDDPAKEHLSILGEFGTGKTWLTLHYAAQALRAYREAQAKGMNRPRLPIVIPLRDYAKAVSVESLFSEFFFRKHEIPIPGYSAFEQLNRMGKLLLIFDGFDEMAARVDKQQMINNFWELAKVVVPGSKVVLTCRTEHFPEAREGRALLNAELQASTKDLTGETPQFEVLELEKFEDDQIRQVLALQASEGTVAQVLGNPQLLDLARRPVMTELILEALPEIEAGKPVDMSRVYLYAVKRKMERDIKAERTFTSMADKLYFLCELSWEMLSSDRMSINYREFPDRIRKLFGAAVQEEKDLDHWHYDMMGQTMLIRNADGDYSPAHRSLLEFFVAFKFAAELGALAPDFLELAQMRSDIDRRLDSREYTWSEYFETRENVAPLSEFKTEKLETLRSTFGKDILAKAVLELLTTPTKSNKLPEILASITNMTKTLHPHEVGAVNGNMITLFSRFTENVLSMYDFSQLFIKGADFENSRLQKCNFQDSVFEGCKFTRILGKVSTLAFSPDGKLLATGDSSNAIRLWDVQTGREVKILQGHASWGYSVSFSPDGSKLVSGSYDGKVKIWSLADGKCINTLHGHTDWVRSVTFSPDGCYIASASSEIFVWDASSGELLKSLQGHDSWIYYSIAFSPNTNELVSGSYDKTVRVWDLSSGESVMTLHGHEGSVQAVIYNSSGDLIVSAGEVVKIWNAKTGTCLGSLEGHQQDIWSVQFSPKGDLLVTASADQAIKVWDFEVKKCIRTLQGHTDRIYAVRFHPSGDFFASASHDATVRFWDSESGEFLKAIDGYSHGIISIRFSLDGKYLALGCSDKSARILEWINQDDCNSVEVKNIYEDAAGGGWVQSVSFSPNGSSLISAGISINIWDLQQNNSITQITGHHSLTLCTVFSTTGILFASCGDEAQIKLWDSKTYKCLRVLEGHTNRIWKIAFTRDEKFIVSCSSDENIKIWRVDSGECISTRLGHRKRIYALDINPVCDVFASGGDDRFLRLWNFESQDYVWEAKGHDSAIISLCFSPDGNVIATGSDDHTVRIWDTLTGECLRILVGHTTTVNEVAFHPKKNNILVSGGSDGSLKFWNSSTGQCLRTFRDRPYESMNITGVKGLTSKEITSLKALGAIDHNDPRGEP